MVSLSVLLLEVASVHSSSRLTVMLGGLWSSSGDRSTCSSASVSSSTAWATSCAVEVASLAHLHLPLRLVSILRWARRRLPEQGLSDGVPL